eukprot:Tbor_TRINITY_DN7743_c0_g1::TRINITY_DN7743_c0_g1_i1::g.12409::m.12409
MTRRGRKTLIVLMAFTADRRFESKNISNIADTTETTTIKKSSTLVVDLKYAVGCAMKPKAITLMITSMTNITVKTYPETITQDGDVYLGFSMAISTDEAIIHIR